MKNFLTLLLLCSCLFLIGCGSAKLLEKPQPILPTDRNYSARFDDIWNATLKAISYFPLTVIEKNSGIINTDWIEYVDTVKVNVWRGLTGGGQVDDAMPVEVMHRLNVLVSQKDSAVTNVKIIRYAKVRPYNITWGGVGNWEPNVKGNFEQTTSNTVQENKILNEIEHILMKK